jgi:hypothetical protein
MPWEDSLLPVHRWAVELRIAMDGSGNVAGSFGSRLPAGHRLRGLPLFAIVWHLGLMVQKPSQMEGIGAIPSNT